MPVVVGGEHLGLERGHVDAERALALAGLAFQAQVEDAVKPLAAEGGHGVRFGQRLDQRARSPASGMLLLPGCHVGRAHHSRPGLAAQPDVHAPVGGAEHSSALLEGQPGSAARRLPVGPSRWLAQMLGHRLGTGDLAWVHPPVRVE